ncbi:hypothetical protein ES319_A05G385800v1 [Gossypium barbadense]|uniref:Uncharacterized protein n=1 Tax=Gossypium barbadense TaxID=3634 RepID=A0A5J5W1H0_GOSBA|nr:hypothetical protein ES319_A05G385800v1 [Gossypium barbadense]KAB2085206.1 hypothetical protein ES319_A05G385800v1 [Gossypium barbadense]KAB2085207.1 hypothetical protein ES319_A05G385800v1 [Gossypium barbadense]
MATDHQNGGSDLNAPILDDQSQTQSLDLGDHIVAQTKEVTSSFNTCFNGLNALSANKETKTLNAK